VVDPHHRDHEPQVDGDGRLGGEDQQEAVLDPVVQVVDPIVALDDPLRLGEIAVQEGLGARRDGLSGERGQADDVTADLIELFLERLATFVAGGNRNAHSTSGRGRTTWIIVARLPDGKHCPELTVTVPSRFTFSSTFRRFEHVFSGFPTPYRPEYTPCSPVRYPTATGESTRLLTIPACRDGALFPFPTREDSPIMTRTSRRARWILVLLVVFGLVAAACSSDDKKSNSGGSTATTKKSPSWPAEPSTVRGHVPAGVLRDRHQRFQSVQPGVTITPCGARARARRT
jgi:hypothetical protein